MLSIFNKGFNPNDLLGWDLSPNSLALDFVFLANMSGGTFVIKMLEAIFSNRK